jgi:hypothetical protein
MPARRSTSKQLDLINFVSSANGYRTDDEVRAQFGNDAGSMKRLTGPISKHIKTLVESGVLRESIPFVGKTESNPDNRNTPGGFRRPKNLVPVVREGIDAL